MNHKFPNPYKSNQPCARCGAWQDEAQDVECSVPLCSCGSGEAWDRCPQNFPECTMSKLRGGEEK